MDSVDLISPSAHLAQRRSGPTRSQAADSLAANGDPPRDICQICDKPYHSARNCHNRLNTEDYPPTNRRSADRQRQPGKKQAFTAYTSPSAITDPWVVDSGASNHVTADLGGLDLSSDYVGSDNLIVGNAESLPITHTGTYTLPALHDASKLSLNNILVVPKISQNLLSVSQLCKDNNVSVELLVNYCLIKDSQGRKLIQGVVENGLYRLPIHSSSPRVFR